jgi:septal ring factor EnvC (AmiA/AmiB activator)
MIRSAVVFAARYALAFVGELRHVARTHDRNAVLCAELDVRRHRLSDLEQVLHEREETITGLAASNRGLGEAVSKLTRENARLRGEIEALTVEFAASQAMVGILSHREVTA